MQKRPAVIRDRRIRIAVIGCGRIATNHFKSIQQHREELDLVAVCDTDPAALAAAQKEYGVPGYSSLPELLQTDVDVVALCTPSGLHPTHAILAARSGRHIITEKPMATRWSDGLRMVRECDEAGVHLLVVKQNRRNSTLQLLKRAMESRRFGRLHGVDQRVLVPAAVVL